MILTRVQRFGTVTPVWIHRWIWNDAQSLTYRRGTLLFFKVIHQISRSHGLKNWWFYPIWVRLLGRSQLSNPSDLHCFVTGSDNELTKSRAAWLMVPSQFTADMSHVFTQHWSLMQYFSTPHPKECPGEVHTLLRVWASCQVIQAESFSPVKMTTFPVLTASCVLLFTTTWSSPADAPLPWCKSQKFCWSLEVIRPSH